jgi:predicted ATPase
MCCLLYQCSEGKESGSRTDGVRARHLGEDFFADVIPLTLPQREMPYRYFLVRGEVQDTAHGSLLRGARHLLHAQIAEALETRSPELMDSRPELFAQHYTEAGLGENRLKGQFLLRQGHAEAAEERP